MILPKVDCFSGGGNKIFAHCDCCTLPMLILSISILLAVLPAVTAVGVLVSVFIVAGCTPPEAVAAVCRRAAASATMGSCNCLGRDDQTQ